MTKAPVRTPRAERVSLVVGDNTCLVRGMIAKWRHHRSVGTSHLTYFTLIIVCVFDIHVQTLFRLRGK